MKDKPSFHYCFAPVANRGTPPAAFLEQLLTWGRTAPDDIFAPNASSQDIYSLITPALGHSDDMTMRRATMLEVLRVLAGFESSWNWNEGVDITNLASMRNIQGRETGIFQVSFDSLGFDPDALVACVTRHTVERPDVLTFLGAMKQNHTLAMEYCARLLRVSSKWDGPIERGDVRRVVNRFARDEFYELLKTAEGEPSAEEVFA